MGIQRGCLSVKAAINVWKALVRVIMEYGAEVWCECGNSLWEEAEKIQREMARRILGCSSKTACEVLLGELGWWTMKGRRDMLRLRFWGKIIMMK